MSKKDLKQSFSIKCMILWRICTSNLVLIYYIIRYKRGFHLLAHSIKEFARFQSKSIL